ARFWLFDPEQIGIEGLAAVVHLGAHGGPVLRQPLGDAAGGGGVRPVALDDRDDLVLVAHEVVEQADGGLGEVGGRRADAHQRETDPVALVHGPDVGGGVAHGAGDLTGGDPSRGVRHRPGVVLDVGLRVV